MNEDNKSYVYVHRLVKTNEVFYVGSGKAYRMCSRHGRSIPWNNIVKENDWCYSVVKSNMSKEEAANLEVALISIYKPKANIHKTTLEAKAFSESDITFIQNRYIYDASSPSSLRYKVDNNQNGAKKKLAGEVAGCLCAGRYSVFISNRRAFAHRVIWYLLKNEDPVGFVIDHIDGDSKNNNIENLRKVSTADNNKNTKLKSSNTSGYKGVTFSKKNYCSATVSINSKNEIKHFSIHKYGKELALALAVEYRFNKIKEAVDNGESYSDRHIGKYVRLPALDKFSTNEIQQMFADSIIVTNTSGKSNVHFKEDRGHSYWIFAAGKTKINFSVAKFGETTAKLLAFECADRHKGLPPKSITGYSLGETDGLLNVSTSVNNTSGFKGIQFFNRKNGLQVKAQVGVNYKGYSKTFDCNELGITVALYEALKWRNEFNKQLRLKI